MKKIIAIFLTLGILLTVAACSATSPEVLNVDGEIKGSGGIKNGLFEGFGSVKPTADADVKYSVEAEVDASAGDIYPSEKVGGAYDEAEVYEGKVNISSGTLTAAEWKDLDEWQGWLDFINDNSHYAIAESWGQLANKRVKVVLKNGDTPIKNAKVELLNKQGKTLFSAVSDFEGCAYLFYDLKGKTSQDEPTKIVAKAVDGTRAEADFAGETEVSMNMAAKNEAVKLDLMFVVDTTGSMSDELEYLKAELRDVVIKAGQAQDMKIRTSVNFYRDEGDEYVVRYFGFKDDIAEAVANISAQYSDGGGDYAEAVHTALDNAVFGHAWDKDAVKLLFLVLDAPPHENKEVMESLEKTILAAAEQGIRIIPISSSGTDVTCEVLFRTWAALTGGTYAFITDHSGIGNPHAAPTLSGDYNVEKLNAMLIRLIGEYCS